MVIHDSARITIGRGLRRGARLGAAIALAFALPALADPGALRANPAGSVSIHTPTLPQPEPPAPTGPAGDLPVDSGSSKRDLPQAPRESDSTEPADKPLTDDASKPLGANPSRAGSGDSSAEHPTTSGGGWGLRTALALAAVLGLIVLCKAAFVFLARRGGGSIAAQLGASGRAPSGLLSVLARYPVAKGTTLVLLRLDRRVLLLSQTSQGFTTLTEIDDPEEVATLIMRAEDEEGASMTRRFRSMLAQAGSDPELIGEREYEIEPVVPMTPRVATARFHDLAIQQSADGGDHADAVGSLRDRLRSLREVTA
ncbi:MAG: flagellar biosynthetic protein FliO [Phycisphaeraceae bacterium]|nr:flagellar biosynthetic protein FliO [Phycisphaeraceae bacterium]